MKTNRKSITATTVDGNKVRVSVPVEFDREPTQGHRQVGTGIVRIGFYYGRKWTVVRDYSIWVKKDGSVEGDFYTAYPAGSEEIPSRHYTDIAMGGGL